MVSVSPLFFFLSFDSFFLSFVVLSELNTLQYTIIGEYKR
jgi:hypothetical protein